MSKLLTCHGLLGLIALPCAVAVAAVLSAVAPSEAHCLHFGRMTIAAVSEQDGVQMLVNQAV